MTEAGRWQQHEGPVLDVAKGFEVIACEACGFTHIVPIPTREDLELVYREDYYLVNKPRYFAHYREDLDWWYLVYAERYDFFEQHLPPHRRRILDIGSGPGFFLKLGQERSWQTLGIEPSRPAAEHARHLGVRIVNDFLHEGNVDQFGRFDVVHLYEVLEHLPDPARMVQLAHGLLDPGGLLCVTVPNDYNPLQQVLRQQLGYAPWWVAPPHHINYFNFDSLQKLLEGAGFDVMQKTASFPMEMFLLMGENYVGDEAMGRRCHGKRKQFDQHLHHGGLGPLKQQWYEALAAIGLGRDATVVARKRAS